MEEMFEGEIEKECNRENTLFFVSTLRLFCDNLIIINPTLRR